MTSQVTVFGAKVLILNLYYLENRKKSLMQVWLWHIDIHIGSFVYIMDKVMLILGPPYKHTVTFKLGLLFIYIRPQYEYEMDHKYAKGQRGRSGQA